jgi:internalin A
MAELFFRYRVEIGGVVKNIFNRVNLLIFISILNIQATPSDNNKKELIIKYISQDFTYEDIVSSKNLDSIFNKIISMDTSSKPASWLKIEFFFQDSASYLPENIGNFNNLERLHIYGYGDSLLPENICNLQNLKQLIIQYSNITKLPDNFGNLSQLEKIDIQNHSLPTLPESFGKLSHLENLSINNGSLTHLPESFGSLINLKRLSIQKNNLVKLPQSFVKLGNLEHLELSKNNLTQLPESFSNLTALKTLYINENQLSYLPESIEKLKNLYTLNVSRNNLVKLPDNIGSLSSLNILDISYNKITKLPASFNSLNISELNVKRNPRLKMTNKHEIITKDYRKKDSIYFLAHPNIGIFLSYPQIVSLEFGGSVLFELFGLSLLGTVGISSIKSSFGFIWNIPISDMSFNFYLFDSSLKIQTSICHSYFWKNISNINKKSSYLGFNLAIGLFYFFEIDFGVYKKINDTDSKDRIFEVGFGIGIFQSFED